VGPTFLIQAPANRYESAGRTFSRHAAEEACRDLPRHDPITAQRLLCDMLAKLDRSHAPDPAQLDALLALEGHARRVSDRLLLRYVEGNAQLRAFERSVFVAAMQLSHSMVQAYGHYMLHIAKSRDGEWLAHAGRVVVALLFHRQVEFLLRCFRYKKRNAEQWRSLHETYRFALERDLHRVPVQMDASPAFAMTPEQQYIQILLLDLVNGGQFSPREAWWSYSWFARWCTGLTLRSQWLDAERGAAPGSFTVDLAGTDGATRASPTETAGTLRLDLSPVMAMIDGEMASLRDSNQCSDDSAPTRDSQLVLLSKLRILLAPERVRVARRGERKAVDATVQAIVGVPRIVQWLREASRPGVAAATSSALDESTIQAFGGATRTPVLATWAAAEPGMCPLPVVWQVRDRSDSGCRMRGKTADLNRVIPGSLIAIRPDENAPWTVTAVRRLRRLMVDHVEIAVELIGRKPRYVKMVAEPLDDALAPVLPDTARRCFGALYLPPSEENPTVPIRSLLLPAREFRAGGRMTLLSSNAVYTLRLHEPMQRDLDLVWTSFTVEEKTSSRQHAALSPVAPMPDPSTHAAPRRR
jgi:hypothetical protein